MVRPHVERHGRASAGTKGILLVLGIFAVYLMHQDVWNWTRVEPLLFGFLPIGLWYHAAYSLLGVGVDVVTRQIRLAEIARGN